MFFKLLRWKDFMNDQELFLGLPIDTQLQKALNQGNSHAQTIFIDNESDYLHHTELEGITYLGKHLGASAQISFFEQLEANIISIISRLAPDYSFQDKELQLIAINQRSK
jgi:hypothetical protein